MTTLKLEFPGHSGAALAARLDLPDGQIVGYAVFAHCFTCSKDLIAVRRIGAGLARHGIALMRFDFTGLGSSEGEFASTNFSSNVQDLKLAVAHLAHNHGAPHLLIGHSLGGTAALLAAADLPHVRAVATIGAPASVAHVLHQFHGDLDRIQADGKAPVCLQGRSFTIERQFIEDASGTRVLDAVAGLRRPLLIMHAPLDETVDIDNASQLFTAAKHPKSFVSLDKADHLLTRAEDAEFAASVIAGWAQRYVRSAGRPSAASTAEGPVLVTETRQGKFQQRVHASGHALLVDEPRAAGGDETGPTPYDLLAASLGACTSMTLRSWARIKGIELDRISVEVEHGKVHAADCADCAQGAKAEGGRIDRFERRIRVEGGVSDELAANLVRIADLCPVHKSLHRSSEIVTRVVRG